MQKSFGTANQGGYSSKPDFQKRKAEAELEEPAPIKKQKKWQCPFIIDWDAATYQLSMSQYHRPSLLPM